MNFTAQYQYTFEEFKEAVDEIGKSVIRLRKYLLGWITFIGLAVIFFLLLNKTTPTSAPAPAPSQPNPVMDILIPLIPWLIIFGFIWFFVFRRLRGRYRTAWERAPVLHRARTLQVSDDGLVFTDPMAEHRLSWGHYLRHVETRNLFLLFTSPNFADFIPKRIFPDARALDAFRELLERNISAPTGAFPVVPISQSSK